METAVITVLAGALGDIGIDVSRYMRSTCHRWIISLDLSDEMRSPHYLRKGLLGLADVASESKKHRRDLALRLAYMAT